MRIEQLALERYGIFTDRVLTFDPQASLHVVLGANEAGKTSALSAIGDLLFGFGARTDYDFRHESRTLRVGGVFRRTDGGVIAARRRKGNKNTLLDADDHPLADDPFAALLGSMSRAAFDQEFGMTAQSLREGGDALLGAAGRLAETLAASSAGMAELARVKDRLQTRADELFTARKSAGKPFYLAADRRDAADKALREAVVTRDALRQLQASVTEAGEKLERLQAAHASSGVTLARWQRTLRVRSPLARLDAIVMELAALADLPAVTAQMLADWRGALEGRAEVDAEIAVLDAAEAADAAEIAAMTVDDTLLADDAAIETLRERIGAVRKAAEDLPRRRHDRDAAEALLDGLARRLGLTSHAELLARLPTDPALADARERIAAMRSDLQALAEAEARHARAMQEREQFEAQASEAKLVSDIEPLRNRFAALGDIPAQDDRLHRERAALAVELQALDHAALALDPSPGALHRLRALPLPDRAAIATLVGNIEIREAELARCDQMIAAHGDTIAAAERELARLSHEGTVPTKADLVQARQMRDARLGALRADLDGAREARIAGLDGVVEASRAIDGITDGLLTDTERATRQEDARHRLAEARDVWGREQVKRDGVQQALNETNDAWARTWEASGLQPRGVAQMLRWREQVDAIIARLEKADLQRVEIDALASTLDAGKMATVSFLETMGFRSDSALPPGVLYREAKGRFEQLQAVWADAKARMVAETRIARDLTEAADACERIRARIDGLRQQWPQVVQAIGLAADATPAQAEAALAVWNAVSVPRASHEREGRSVDTIEADLRAFDADVAALCARVAPELRDLPAREALSRISERLAEARRVGETRRRLQAGAAKRAATRAALVVKRSASVSVLDDACRTLGVADSAVLAEPLARLATRLDLQAEQATLRRQLAEIADGHDEETLRREREGIDLDGLRAEIDRETVHQSQVLKDIAEASAEHHQRQNELAALTRGRDAAGAMARRTEAEAEMVSVAESWLLRSAAALLARRAIELHRAKVQDPTIARAGELFALATAGAFAGLGVDYGDQDEPMLVARRAAGARVPVSGLSEGTRDQLYLALRLALLERQAAERMPFIGDDLLASFDEARTLATLRLLAAAGRQRQMIVFTHHRHVADLALSITDQPIDLISL